MTMRRPKTPVSLRSQPDLGEEEQCHAYTSDDQGECNEGSRGRSNEAETGMR